LVYDQEESLEYVKVESFIVKAAEYTDIVLPASAVDRPVPNAFIINDSELAYGMFMIDERSLKWLDFNLARLPDRLTRQAVMLQTLLMMQHGHCSIYKIQYLLEQLNDETSTITLDLLYKIMYKAQSNWLPLDLAAQVNKMVADFFIIKAFNSDDKKMQQFCILKSIDFIFEQEDLDMLKSWYLEHGGKVCVMEKVLEMSISTEMSYTIFKKIYKSAAMTD